MRLPAMGVGLFLVACSPAGQAGPLAQTTSPGAATAGVGMMAATGANSAGAAQGASAGAIATAPKPTGAAGATLGTAGATTASAGSSAAVSGSGGSQAAGGAGTATAGASGMAGTMGGAGASASGQTIPGCTGSTLLPVPENTAMRGPWPIGNKTLKFGRFSAVEVFYPAQPGSEQGKESVKFDMRQFLPPNERSKVPDAEATIVDAHTYRDLPLDTAHGPYPVVILVHGTASFRLGSVSSETLWASRGFIVMAADHPGLYLADYLGCGGQIAGTTDLSADVDSEIAALTTASDDLAFLAGHIDMKRVALVGHSAGAYNVASFTTKPGVQAVIGLAGTRAAKSSPTLKSVLYVAGMSDSVLPYGPGGFGLGSTLYPGSDVDAYNGSPGPTAVKKRLVGITNGGHLTPTDLCGKNAKGEADLDVAQAHGVCGVSGVAPLADCATADPAKGILVSNDVMTGVLEETLQCQDRAAWISGLKARHPVVGDFKEATK